MPQQPVKKCVKCAAVIPGGGRCLLCKAAQQRTHRAANYERIYAQERAYKAAHVAEARQYRDARKDDPAYKSAVNAACKRWRRTHRSAVVQSVTQRRMRRIQATPVWCDRALVAAIYKCARQIGWHVHHPAPIVSDMVCGLHVPLNLHIVSPERHREIHRG